MPYYDKSLSSGPKFSIAGYSTFKRRRSFVLSNYKSNNTSLSVYVGMYLSRDADIHMCKTNRQNAGYHEPSPHTFQGTLLAYELHICILSRVTT